jgi:hypothetical protein
MKEDGFTARANTTQISFTLFAVSLQYTTSGRRKQKDPLGSQSLQPYAS